MCKITIKDVFDIAFSFLSIFIALTVYVSSRKSFKLDIANKRANKVNDTFTNILQDKTVPDLEDNRYKRIWTVIVSEIIISKNILDKLSWKKPFLKKIEGNRDIHYIFWEQLNTSIRDHFKSFDAEKQSKLESYTSLPDIFKQQIKDIIEYSKKIESEK